ncbi:MAG: SIMPL domain-containing protein [Gemmatimonadaceae bacterium]|jgi:hypothetical protein|nr:SIMPL domain-containing protein [Gemmatimonadaceae bacterium]
MRLTAPLLLALAASPLIAQPPAMYPPPPPEISITTTATAKLVPDRARISIGVQTDASTAAAAGATNARRTAAVRDALIKLGVPATDVGTTNYSVSPNQRWDPKTNQATVTSYRVANTVMVVLKEPDLAGRAIDAALTAGANMIQGLEFYAANDDAPRREALAKAMASARADAAALADAAGATLKGLLSANYGAEPPMPKMVMQAQMMSARAEADASTPVSAGEQLVTVTVSTRWEIARKN